VANEDEASTVDPRVSGLVYQFPRLTREEIRAMRQLPIDDVKKTRFYQEVFNLDPAVDRFVPHARA
jgi:predicted transposase YdaD